MSKKLYEESNIQDIADAIREKNGEETAYKVSEMADAILAIETTEPVLQEKTAYLNGLVTADSGYDGLSRVMVSVRLQEKIITDNGTVYPDSSYTGLSKVVVNVGDSSRRCPRAVIETLYANAAGELSWTTTASIQTQ